MPVYIVKTQRVNYQITADDASRAVAKLRRQAERGDTPRAPQPGEVVSEVKRYDASGRVVGDNLIDAPETL